jgi:hypothetical protein
MMVMIGGMTIRRYATATEDSSECSTAMSQLARTIKNINFTARNASYSMGGILLMESKTV